MNYTDPIEVMHRAQELGEKLRDAAASDDTMPDPRMLAEALSVILLATAGQIENQIRVQKAIAEKRNGGGIVVPKVVIQ